MAKSIKPEYVADTLPIDIAAGIGMIIYRWSRLEYQLSNMIAHGFGLPKDTARALTIGMEIKVACGIIRTMTFNDRWVKDAILREEIRTLVKEIGDKSDDRHNYAHGVIGYDLDDPGNFARYLFKSAAHRIEPSSEPITVEILGKISDEALSFLRRAIDLTVRLIALNEKHASEAHQGQTPPIDSPKKRPSRRKASRQ